jgi:hypothetical protein
MNRSEHDKWLDEALFDAIGSKKSKVDFEEWQAKHSPAIEMLTSRAGRRSSAGGPPDRIWRTNYYGAYWH